MPPTCSSRASLLNVDDDLDDSGPNLSSSMCVTSFLIIRMSASFLYFALADFNVPRKLPHRLFIVHHCKVEQKAEWKA